MRKSMHNVKLHKDGTASITSSIDSLSDSVERLNISNDDQDDDLFKDPPPKEDCQICFLPMPHAVGICGVRKSYMPCCGKILCGGCVMASLDEMKKGNMKHWCSYCRVPHPENDRELKKRMKLLDDEAFYVLGTAYRDGTMGLPKSLNKSIELFSKAAELGSCRAHYNLGNAYQTGQGVEKDMKRAIHHWRLAAIGGNEQAREEVT